MTDSNSTVAEQPAARRLVGIDDVCPGRVQMSKRAWLRLCDAGRAPWGLKLGGRRLWDAAELDRWIAGGCRPVRPAGGTTR